MGYDFFNFKCDKLNGNYCIVTGTEVSNNQKSEVCTSSLYLDCEIYQKCYIVTAVCETLKGKQEFLDTAMHFRNQLEHDPKHLEVLAVYDAIGPVIANRIRGNERVCKILFERTVKPVCKLIEAGQDEMALKQFSDMVVQFIEPECRTNQESVKPNGVFTELMQYDPKTIRDCEQAATTHFCTYQIDKYNQTQKRLGSIVI